MTIASLCCSKVPQEVISVSLGQLKTLHYTTGVVCTRVKVNTDNIRQVTHLQSLSQAHTVGKDAARARRLLNFFHRFTAAVPHKLHSWQGHKTHTIGNISAKHLRLALLFFFLSSSSYRFKILCALCPYHQPGEVWALSPGSCAPVPEALWFLRPRPAPAW